MLAGVIPGGHESQSAKQGGPRSKKISAIFAMPRRFLLWKR